MDKLTKKISIGRQLTTRAFTRYPEIVLNFKNIFAEELYFPSCFALDGNLGFLGVALLRFL